MIYAGNKNYWINGRQDEVRVSDATRSAAWIKASYETGRDDLLDYGSEEVKAVAVSNIISKALEGMGLI